MPEVLTQDPSFGASFVIGAGFMAGQAQVDNRALKREFLTPATMATLIQMARDIYPLEQVQDESYAQAVKGYDNEKAAPGVEMGISALNAAAHGKGCADYVNFRWARDRVSVLRAIADSAFFQQIRGGLVTGLYNQNAVWPIFAVKNDSYSAGGYIDYGFDDIGDITGLVYVDVEGTEHDQKARILQDECRHDPRRGFISGFEFEMLILGLPIMVIFFDRSACGREFTTALGHDKKVVGMWIVGKDMPQETNRITLKHEVKAPHGLPVTDVYFDDHPNDVAKRNHVYMQDAAVYEAVGATLPYPLTQDLETNRMSANTRDRDVNAHGRTHDIANPFV
ncbi:MAG: hypothetical protein R8G34_15945 [Paracoccaceae bacterium]|nr:hypothetical protein [Paracoccaceae bacterium]